jgi:hypothetical protein
VLRFIILHLPPIGSIVPVSVQNRADFLDCLSLRVRHDLRVDVQCHRHIGVTEDGLGGPSSHFALARLRARFLSMTLRAGSGHERQPCSLTGSALRRGSGYVEIMKLLSTLTEIRGFRTSASCRMS